MLLLALDTSTPAITAALADDRRVLAERTTVDPRRHGELLAPGIADVLARAGVRRDELTHVIVGVGPGPFTGLRVGLVTALTLGAALEVPVHGVCSLDVLAWDGEEPGEFGVATDARRREVYWARYTDRRTRVEGPSVGRPAEVAPVLGTLPVVGAGALMYPDVLRPGRGPRHPSAAAMAALASERLAAGESLLPPRPLYLRRPDAVEPGLRKPVLR